MLRRRIRSTQWKVLSPLLRASAQMIAVSRFERAVLASATAVPGDRIRVNRNGGTLPAPPPSVQVVPGRIVSSGRLERYKGHHRAIEALVHVRRRLPEAHLHILGSGPYEGDLRALAARRRVSEAVTIHLVPPGDRREMARNLAEAAVVVALSDYEAHPVAVMEALALGRPVVGYDVAGVADLVEDGLVAGLEPGAPAAQAAEAVLAALNAPGLTATRRSVALPTWEAAVEELVDIYHRAAGRQVIGDDGREPALAGSGW